MLTQQDLSQIKTIVGDVIDQKLKPINEKLDSHDKKFDNIDKKFDNIDKKFDNIDTEFKEVNKKISKIQKDIKTVINYFDHDLINHKQRLSQIEHCLNLKPPA